MSKLAGLLDELKQGHSVRVQLGGGLMRGRIEIDQVVTLTPIDASNVQINDVVFVRWHNGNFITHLVTDIQDGKYLIANNLGKINGWVDGSDILAVVTEIEPLS